MKLKPVKEQVIVITGGTSGIGLTTAKMAASRGAQVVVMARDEAGLRQVCEEIRAEGGRADWVSGDVGVREDVRRAVDEVVSRFGGFDTWVNDAGVGAYAKLEEMKDADHERMFQTNYWGVVYGSIEALKHLKTKPGGALINIGSIASEMPAPVLGAYTASKHAVKGFTDSLRIELMQEDAPVSVTLIQPSGIHTPFGEHAINYMDNASVVPPPVYAPEVVADAILHAAEHPERDLIVGGAGRGMIFFSRWFPSLADKLFGPAFFKTAVDPSRPPRDSQGLHRPGTSGKMYGDQGGYMLKSSLYTQMRTRPVTTAATAAAFGVGGALFAAWALGPKAQGEQKSNEPVS